MEKRGSARAMRIPRDTTRAGHGRRWMTRLQRYQNDVVDDSSVRWRKGTRRRSIVWPTKPRTAGSHLNVATTKARTDTTTAEGVPEAKVRPHRVRASNQMVSQRPRDAPA